MNVVDIRTYPVVNKRFDDERQKIVELLDYMGRAGKRPTEIKLFPAGYRALVGAINKQQRAIARAAAKAENDARMARGVKEKATPAPVLVDAITYDGIPLGSQPYSRPRPVKA